MKKIHILGLFLLIFSFFLVIFPKTANADIDGYSLTINCMVSQTSQSQPTETNAYSSSTRTLTMDYSDFLNGGNIYLSADLIATEESTMPVGPIYSWTIDKTIVSQSKELTLHSRYTTENFESLKNNINTESINGTLIKVGTTKIILTVSDSNSARQITTDITISITDNNSNLTMNCTTSEIPNSINKQANELYFYANIPTTSKLVSYMWQLKTPNSSTYLTTSNTFNYTFSRLSMISAYGYGEYKLMAIGTDSKTSTTYYSSVYTLNVTPDEIVIAPGAYSIISKTVTNTLTNIEAFEYTLSSTTNLIPENVHWYLNNKKIASGLTFTYEPTTRSEYKLSVKYTTSNGTTLELASPIRENPQTTGMLYMYLTIGAVVFVVLIILVISIKVSNKKRDVVW